ncbi:benenodin family lasso peptide (plasmid) [Novosphingobium resinovorum]|nr:MULTISPECIES: benenodin family lasso peptide [Novosphingobium]MBF7015116.1 benenodin family lasso peptide [Novosphingobium sp. HR1a]WJM29802.1 benenodin family lasso peptide [Novosphingobium resinovorum]
MDRNDELLDEVIELGMASIETKGPPGVIDDNVGKSLATGLTDE